MQISGIVVTGLGEAPAFTQLDWVVEQCRRKLGFQPFPGTLNLEVLPRDLGSWHEIKKQPAIVLEPPDPSFCKADCHLVVLPASLTGAVLVPRVEGYPETKIEIVAPVHLLSTLALSEGDVVSLQIQ